MFCSPNFNTLKDSGKYPSGVCRSGVGRNSIFCNGCSHWVHKRCSNILGRLTVDPAYWPCSRCLDRLMPECVTMLSLKTKRSNCRLLFYLGDSITPGGGCEAATVTRSRCSWGKFRELLPILVSTNISLATHRKIYVTCVRSALLNHFLLKGGGGGGLLQPRPHFCFF